MSNKLEDSDFVEYWRQQFKLDDLREKYCLNCEYYFLCWHYGEGCCYREDCKIKDMRRVILAVKEKTSKYTEALILDTVITAVARRIINPKNLSVWQKIKAIAGLEENIGFCPKHKIYFYREPLTAQMNQDIMYTCPLCIKELKKRVLKV